MVSHIDSTVLQSESNTTCLQGNQIRQPVWQGLNIFYKAFGLKKLLESRRLLEHLQQYDWTELVLTSCKPGEYLPVQSGPQSDLSNSLHLIRLEEDFLAIHKPPGIPFQQTPDHPGVMSLVRQLPGIPAEPRLYPVHRLDRVTSGILLIARGRKAANELGNAFRHNRVHKIYVAISDRKPQKKQGTISGDMQKGRRGSWILTRSHTNPAVTRFKSSALPHNRPGLRVFILQPRTGKTHQLRVALKSIGAPILGDPLYSRYDLARQEDRTYLHATAIRFELNGSQFSIIDPPSQGELFTCSAFQKVYLEQGDLLKTISKADKTKGN